MTLLFARHGESQANALHVFSNRGFQHPLTEKGVRQAKELADKLRAYRITRVYSSPLLRAVQTSDWIVQSLGINKFRIHENLREYDVGLFEGRSDPKSWQIYEELEEKWKTPEFRQEKIQGGESFDQIQRRFRDFIAQVNNDHMLDEGCILVITHGGLLKVGLPAVMENITYEFSARNPIRNCDWVVGRPTPKGLICETWGRKEIGRQVV
jgi:broad specificity phosphatase PhoE